MPRPLRVAIVGAGPAGIYAADALLKSDVAADPGVSIDLFERMPEMPRRAVHRLAADMAVLASQRRLAVVAADFRALRAVVRVLLAHASVPCRFTRRLR